MKKRIILTMLLSSLLLSSCAYTNIQMPMDKNFNETELGSKEGKSSTHLVLFLLSWGDSGTRAAAADGEIKVIKHADRQVFSLLFGLYTRISTVAYGD